MGTKGRNIVLWLLLISLGTVVIALIAGNRTAGQYFFLVAVTLVLFWIKFSFIDMPKARKKSIEIGLEVIDLLPINPVWAKWLVKKPWPVAYAYEIHLRLQVIPPKNLITGMERDLAYIEQNMQGLFLWETNIAVPHRIRRLIKRYESIELAVWETGTWPVPKPPLVGLKPGKKPVRRGAILIGGVESN